MELDVGLSKKQILEMHSLLSSICTLPPQYGIQTSSTLKDSELRSEGDRAELDRDSPPVDGDSTYLEDSLLLFAVVIAYCVLYGPQVMITHWVSGSLLSPEIASLLVYLPLFPMSLTPLCYGYLFGQRETSKLIIGALLALCLTTSILMITQSVTLMMSMRLAQGFILPIIMTAVMSRFSSQGAQRGRTMITYYLCATVIGGLLGRVCSGYLTDHYGTSAPWFLWCVLLLTLSLGIASLKRTLIPYNTQKCTPSRLKQAINQATVRPVLLCGALMFGVFSAALNLLPLRALVLYPEQSSAAVSMRYWGYLAGAIVALYSRSINRALGGRGRAPALGLIIITLALYWGNLGPSVAPLFGMVLLLCIGLFITHPLLAAHITQLSASERGLMSGLYVSSYYIGGALSSAALSLFYSRFGWTASLVLLSSLSLFGALLALLALRGDQGD